MENYYNDGILNYNLDSGEQGFRRLIGILS